MRRRLEAATVAVAVAVVPVAAAPVALAAIQEQAPAQDGVVSEHGRYAFTSNSTVADRPDATMSIVGPGDPPLVIGGSPNDEGFSTVVLDTMCPREPCTIAPNGAYTAVEERVGDSGERRTFFVRIGGLPVPEIAATLADRTATVTWKPGPEADVTGWVVADDQGAVQSVTAPCPESGCSATFPYPPATSGSRTFSVRAARPCGVADCQDVLGSAATSGPVTLPDPPPDATPPDAAPPPASAAPGSPSPAATAGRGLAGRRSLGQGFGSFTPRRPAIPALPGVPPTVAPPQVADTFDPTLSYDGTRDAETGGPQPQAASPSRDGVLTSTGGLVDDDVARSVAGALLLLLVGAHLRAWLSASRPADLG